jgi:hypothetical protein
MKGLLEQLLVWRALGKNKAVRYSCFENLSTKWFCAQSANFLRLPLDPEMLRQHERQLVKLFIEISPLDRCEWFESLGSAIEAHDRTFAWNYPPVRLVANERAFPPRQPPLELPELPPPNHDLRRPLPHQRPELEPVPAARAQR